MQVKLCAPVNPASLVKRTHLTPSSVSVVYSLPPEAVIEAASAASGKTISLCLEVSESTAFTVTSQRP